MTGTVASDRGVPVFRPLIVNGASWRRCGMVLRVVMFEDEQIGLRNPFETHWLPWLDDFCVCTLNCHATRRDFSGLPCRCVCKKIIVIKLVSNMHTHAVINPAMMGVDIVALPESQNRLDKNNIPSADADIERIDMIGLNGSEGVR